jgi:hypothetical protein
MIKNCYLLLLVLKLIDKIKHIYYFIEIDL